MLLVFVIGCLIKVYVQEGLVVQVGDVFFEMMDQDLFYVLCLEQQVQFVNDKVEVVCDQLVFYDQQLVNFEQGWNLVVLSVGFDFNVVIEKVCVVWQKQQVVEVKFVQKKVDFE